MYVKRLQLKNYGPLLDLDIDFPFDGARPKPVLLAGENGSGKTMSISHIVNAMVQAKDAIYEESTELEPGRVFKLRSGSYISVGEEYYYARCDFESGLFVRELRLKQPRHTYAAPPKEMDGRGLDAWDARFDKGGPDHFETNILDGSLMSAKKELVSARCLLYFPSNRAEEPAWLNQASLRAKPRYTEEARLKGETRRRLISRSPLRDIQNWLYDVAYDRAVFEISAQNISIPLAVHPDKAPQQELSLPILVGYSGDATGVYNMTLEVLRTVIPMPVERTGLRFGIGGRHGRCITLKSAQGTVVPNLFQLSGGETALLALFLSILRDFDLREDRSVPFKSAEDVKGLVVVDEVDLHLHAKHQYDVLPRLVKMFPQVQFIMSTHSPLFVLGMAQVLGEDGFQVYDFPSGSRVAPGDFEEIGRAFLAFRATSEFLDEVQARVRQAQRPILFVEGQTDRDYLQRAAKLLEKEHVLCEFEVHAAGGAGQLKTIWKSLANLPKGVARAVVLLHDPESEVSNKDEGNICKRKMPHFEEHPILKGVENLFNRETLERARGQSAKFIDIDWERERTERGESVTVPESWSVNENEKRNLCDWLCAQGAREDFRYFEAVFDLLEPLACMSVPTCVGTQRASGRGSSDV